MRSGNKILPRSAQIMFVIGTAFAMHVNARSSNHDPNHEADRDPKRLSESDSFLCEHSQLINIRVVTQVCGVSIPMDFCKFIHTPYTPIDYLMKVKITIHHVKFDLFENLPLKRIDYDWQHLLLGRWGIESVLIKSSTRLLSTFKISPFQDH